MTTEPVQVKLQYVLEKYGLDPRENFKFSFFSMANEVFFLTDTKGRKLVLKNCLKNRSPELLAVEAAVMAHLNSHGCGAPHPVKALDGSEFVAYHGDYWMMTEHLKGYMPSWNTPLKAWHHRGAVTGLATYHKAISNLDPTLDTGRIRTFDYQKNLQWILDLKAELKADTSGRESVAKMLELLPAYEDWARRLPEFLPPDQVAACEQLMIHGDFHSFNMTYRWRRFSACYDFDFIRRDLKLMDVIWTIRHVQQRFYRKKFGKKLHEKGFEPPLADVEVIEEKALRWFLKVYNRTYRLTKAEVALLPGMNIALALYNVRFFALSHSEEECLGHHRWFSWQKGRIERVAETYQRVIDRVVAGIPE